MKKILACVCIAGTPAACGNDADNNDTADTATTLNTPVQVDSTTVVAPADSTAVSPLVDTVVTDTTRR